jgi:C4-dicarboxylate-specific signal transduction histidine kinase
MPQPLVQSLLPAAPGRTTHCRSGCSCQLPEIGASESNSAFFAVVIEDITERKRAEAELHQKEASLREAQTELAHVSRVTTMGELAASIAHEVNQPLAGIVTNDNASLRWLAGDSPNLAEAREAIRRIIRDGTRAADVISRMRALFQKVHTAKERLDINEAIAEVVILTQSEVRRNKATLRVEPAADLPPVMGDRVQLQQVVMNLILNGIEAMSTVEDRERDLVIKTQRGEGDEVRVVVQDSGIGFDPLRAERIFDAFHTTKPGGLGMGLSISRSIVESHGGRLWAVSNDGPGATFQFTLLKCQ